MREFTFARAVYYSQEQINPIPDYLQHGEYVFLTYDSTSMISEAVSFGSSCVEILSHLGALSGQDKFGRMMATLQGSGSLHLFDGTLGTADKKIDLSRTFQGVVL